MIWENLNRYYEKINKTALFLLNEIRQYAPDAKLLWYNLHEVKRNGKYETEFIPLPEVEADFSDGHIDFGVSFMNEIWAEITVSAEKALNMDLSGIASEREIEIYGSENYIVDFYSEGMDIESAKEKIKISGEKEIKIFFVPKEENNDIISYIMNMF